MYKYGKSCYSSTDNPTSDIRTTYSVSCDYVRYGEILIQISVGSVFFTCQSGCDVMFQNMGCGDMKSTWFQPDDCEIGVREKDNEFSYS